MGSSIFLKNKFGVGYNLTIVKKDQQVNPQIEKLIKSHVSQATVLSDISSEIQFQLPLNALEFFQKLFDELDQNIDRLNIQVDLIIIIILILINRPTGSASPPWRKSSSEWPRTST